VNAVNRNEDEYTFDLQHIQKPGVNFVFLFDLLLLCYTLLEELHSCSYSAMINIIIIRRFEISKIKIKLDQPMFVSQLMLNNVRLWPTLHVMLILWEIATKLNEESACL